MLIWRLKTLRQALSATEDDGEGIFGAIPGAVVLLLILLPNLICRAGPEAPATRPAAADHRETTVRGWFAKLVNRDASVRDEALEALMGLRRSDLPLLEKVVKQSLPLKPAQSVALRQIVIHVYLSGEPYEPEPDSGFLGIKLGQGFASFTGDGDADEPRQGGVVVVKRMPGFCGARVLRDGDVILSIVERPRVQFSTTQEFAAVIRELGSGQTTHFQVLRQGQIIRVPIILDRRPADGALGLDELIGRRDEAADEYWEKAFGSLLKEGLS